MEKRDDRKRGEVPMWRRASRSFYVGRGVQVTVLEVSEGQVRISVEAPLRIAVSGPPAKLEEHLALQQDRESGAVVDGSDLTAFTLKKGEEVLIGRTVRIRYNGEQGRERAELFVAAPPHVAVTRDDFTREEHDKFQNKRDPGERSAI